VLSLCCDRHPHTITLVTATASAVCCPEESEQKMNTSDLFPAHRVSLLPMTQTGIEH
jgi:hypothetical protein